MNQLDTLLASLYLGKLSRDAVNYSNTPRGKEPDHTWSSFKKTDAAFRKVHPELINELNSFMRSYADDIQVENTELFKMNALCKFVSLKKLEGFEF